MTEGVFLALACDWVKLEARFRPHSIYLIKANRMMYNMTMLGQIVKMT